MLWDKSGLLQICISHLNHNREFIYKPRGFESVEDMNKTIIERFNRLVTDEDDLYILGDLCLGGGSEEALKRNKELVSSLRGRLHIIRGNHDTDARVKMYKECPNVVEVVDAKYVKYNGWKFYLTHYPCNTSNLEKDFSKACLINLYGHTHQKTNFYNDVPYMYHVGVDSHNCSPVSVECLLHDIRTKVKECFEQV